MPEVTVSDSRVEPLSPRKEQACYTKASAWIHFASSESSLFAIRRTWHPGQGVWTEFLLLGQQTSSQHLLYAKHGGGIRGTEVPSAPEACSRQGSNLPAGRVEGCQR